MPYRSDLATACAPNPTLFVDEQTDQTAAAVMGLAAVGTDLAYFGAGYPLAHDPRTFLHSQQVTGGGFRYNSTGASDPNSTALGLQGLIALGDDPLASTWKVKGKTAYDGLRSFQLPNGSLYYPGGGTPKPNLLATVQAVPALAGYALPVPHTVIPGVVTKPSPTATATPSASATPAPSHHPTASPTPTASAATVVLGTRLPNTGGRCPAGSSALRCFCRPERRGVAERLPA